MSQAQEIAQKWARAWESADSQAFAALFAADAIYRDDQAGRVSRNQEELKAFHAHFAQALSSVRLVFSCVFQEGANACLEWTFSGVHSGLYHGRVPTGRTFTSPGVSVLTLTPDGKIKTCTDYYDGAAVARQLAV